MVPVLSQGTLVFHMLMDAKAVKALTPRPVMASGKPKTPLRDAMDALRDRRLTVRACMAPIELKLGTLADLRAGDLIPLSHGLHEPLTLRTGITPLFRVHLGRSGARRAVQIAAAE